jgi:hypothetical protein
LAIRTHVIGAKGVSSAELKRALEGLKTTRVTASGDWALARASALKLDSSAIDEALDGLVGPTLRATTVDGALWELRLTTARRKPFVGVHWFALLDEERLQDEAEEHSSFQSFAKAYSIPPKLVRDLKGQRVTKARLKKVLRRHAEHLSETLTRLGLSHRSEELVDALTGESTSEVETTSWDVGNLPRVLSLLGMDAAFPAWREELAEEEEQHETLRRQAAEYARLDAERPLRHIEDCHRETRAVDVSGAPLRLPLPDLETLFYIPWFCRSNAQGGLVIEPVPDAKVRAALEALEPTRCVELDGALHVAFREPSDRFVAPRWIGQAGSALVGIAEGSRVSLLTASVSQKNRDAGETEANHRYDARVDDGELVIERTFPGVDAELLSETLDLMHGFRSGAVTARDEAEIEALKAEGPQKIMLLSPTSFRVKELTIRGRPKDYLEFVVDYLFWRRTRKGPWKKTLV